MYKPQIVRARSPRKLGTTPMRHHLSPYVHSIHHHGHPLGHNLGLVGHFATAQQQQPISSNNCTEEMMEISGIPPV